MSGPSAHRPGRARESKRVLEVQLDGIGKCEDIHSKYVSCLYVIVITLLVCVGVFVYMWACVCRCVCVCVCLCGS